MNWSIDKIKVQVLKVDPLKKTGEIQESGLINVLIYLLTKLYLVNVFKNDLELHVQFFEQDT